MTALDDATLAALFANTAPAARACVFDCPLPPPTDAFASHGTIAAAPPSAAPWLLSKAALRRARREARVESPADATTAPVMARVFSACHPATVAAAAAEESSHRAASGPAAGTASAAVRRYDEMQRRAAEARRSANATPQPPAAAAPPKRTPFVQARPAAAPPA